MPFKWEKAKNALEWAKLLFDIVAAIASSKAVRAFFTSYLPHVSSQWVSAIAWTTAALVLLLLIWWQQRQQRKLPTPGQTAQNVSTNLIGGSTFDATQYFAHVYISSRNAEIESNVRTAASVNLPNDRETFYVRLIATGLISFTYDVIWAYITKSQMLALMELNRRTLLPAEVKTYYDKAASKYPDRYADYSFEQWMEFMKNNLLLLWLPDGMLGITVQGKDFLKYLVHCGRSPDDRVL